MMYPETGALVKAARKSLNATLHEASSWVGMGVSEFHRIEQGNKKFPLDKAVKFCGMFRVSTDELQLAMVNDYRIYISAVIRAEEGA